MAGARAAGDTRASEWGEQQQEEFTGKRAAPPWPEDGSLPPVASVVEATVLPPPDALDPKHDEGVGGGPRYWVRVSDRGGEYRVVACERRGVGQRKPAEPDESQQTAEEAVEGNEETVQGDGDKKEVQADADDGEGKRRRRKKGGRERTKSDKRKSKRTGEEVPEDVPLTAAEKLAEKERQKTIKPSGVSVWSELPMGGEAEGGGLFAQLLALSYTVDKVEAVESHSFLVPSFIRPPVPSGQRDKNVGPDQPVEPSGCNVLVVVERRTLLGGAQATKAAAPSGDKGKGKGKAEDNAEDGAAVIVRVEGTDPTEVERVGRLVSIGTMAFGKVRGVSPANADDIFSRPPTATNAANLSWLNPWRDNDTPANSRPNSGTSARGRPGSGASGRGGGHGAGGLVALPMNRSQRRIRSREGGLRPGGHHGEFWVDSRKAAKAAAGTSGRGKAAAAKAGQGGQGLAMGAMAAAQMKLEAGESSSEEDDYDPPA